MCDDCSARAAWRWYSPICVQYSSSYAPEQKDHGNSRPNCIIVLALLLAYARILISARDLTARLIRAISAASYLCIRF